MRNLPSHFDPDKQDGYYHAFFSMKALKANGFSLYPSGDGRLVPVTGVARSYSEGIECYQWDDLSYVGLLPQQPNDGGDWRPLVGGLRHSDLGCPDGITVLTFDGKDVMRVIAPVKMDHLSSEGREWIEFATVAQVSDSGMRYHPAKAQA